MAVRLLLLLLAVFITPVNDPAAAAEVVTFAGDAKKVLRKHCATCHNRNRASAGLDVTTYEAVLRGGASGEVLLKGDAEDSYLFLVTAHLEEPAMPPSGKRIPDADLEVLRDWINDGLLETAGSAATESVVAAAAPVAKAVPPTQPPLEAPALPPVYRGEQRGPVVALAASEAAGQIAVGGQLQVLVYDARSRQLNRVLALPEGEPQTLRYSADGKSLIAGAGVHAQSGRVVIWDSATGDRRRVVGDEFDVPLAVSLHPTTGLVALGGPERVLRVFDRADQLAYEISKHSGWLLDASFSPDGLLLGSTDRDGGAYLWAAATGERLLTLRGHRGPATRLGWLLGEDRCVTGSRDGRLRVFDLHTGEVVKQTLAHEGGVDGLAVLGDGRIVTSGRDQRVAVWQPSATPATDAKLDANVSAVAALGSDAAVIGTTNGRVRLWRIANDEWFDLEPPESLLTANVADLGPEAALVARLTPMPPAFSQTLADPTRMAKLDSPTGPTEFESRDRERLDEDLVEAVASPGAADRLRRLSRALPDLLTRAELAEQRAASARERYDAATAQLEQPRRRSPADDDAKTAKTRAAMNQILAARDLLADQSGGSLAAQEALLLCRLAIERLERSLQTAGDTAAREAAAAAAAALSEAEAELADIETQARRLLGRADADDHATP